MTSFREELHPRGEGGKFAPKEGGAREAAARGVSEKSRAEESAQIGRLAESKKGSPRELFRQALEKGGFTYDVVNDIFPTSGYVVAAYKGHEQTYSREMFTETALAEYVENHMDFIREHEGVCVGGWYDSESGRWFLDTPVVVDDLDKAMNLARDTQQLAVWNLGEQKEIRTEEHFHEREKPKKE